MSAGPVQTPLDVLAEKMGIQHEFRDARGELVRTSAGTKRSLLAAMGMDVVDDAQAQSTLDVLQQEALLRALPAVRVVRAGEGPSGVAVVFPVQTRKIRWRVRLEQGGERVGEAEFGRLPLASTRTLPDRGLERRRLVLDPALPWGYHELILEPGGASMALIVTPDRCWLPPGMPEEQRRWGLAAQLYLLRSANNWGIGDFTDLKALVAMAAARGADVIGLNPLHALFSDDPEQASPYSPASRLLLNVLNIDVTSIPELQNSPEAQRLIASATFQRRLAACRSQDLVDYTTVTELKLAALAALFETCRLAPDPRRWQAFETFRRAAGGILQRSCVFLALREKFGRQADVGADWHRWPAEFQDAGSEAVSRFSQQQRERVDFIAWLQWIAQDQLAGAAHAAREAGMAIGLYRDLAVGAAQAGAETWINPQVVISGARVGAPPDILNPAGQDWGLPPFNPHALREEGYRSFIELVRANMRCAGGLRIDHVMALQQLYWIPQGGTPREGAYVNYPMDDLVAILALESHRNHCFLVGEDLGTVPENFRERMASAGILSYKVLFFEQDRATERFLAPDDYPPLSLSVTGNHDLATLRGWWLGRDVDVKERLGLLSRAGEAARQRQERRRDKDRLLEALRRAQVWVHEGEPELETLVALVYCFLARTHSCLALVQLDDLTDELDAVNVPATSAEHPNWRRRLSLSLGELASARRFQQITQILQDERRAGRAGGAQCIKQGP
jgi:4-alpha-glucanotransferase